MRRGVGNVIFDIIFFTFYVNGPPGVFPILDHAYNLSAREHGGAHHPRHPRHTSPIATHCHIQYACVPGYPRRPSTRHPLPAHTPPLLDTATRAICLVFQVPWTVFPGRWIAANAAAARVRASSRGSMDGSGDVRERERQRLRMALSHGFGFEASAWFYSMRMSVLSTRRNTARLLWLVLRLRAVSVPAMCIVLQKGGRVGACLFCRELIVVVVDVGWWWWCWCACMRGRGF